MVERKLRDQRPRLCTEQFGRLVGRRLGDDGGEIHRPGAFELQLVAGAQLLWRPGEPPILFAAFFIQWLQISLSLFRASFYGVELHELLLGSNGIVAATWLSLFGLMALAVGIRLILRGVGPGEPRRAVPDTSGWSDCRGAVGVN